MQKRGAPGVKILHVASGKDVSMSPLLCMNKSWLHSRLSSALDSRIASPDAAMLKPVVLLLAATTASALLPGRGPALRRVVTQPRAFTPFLAADDAAVPSPSDKIAAAVCACHSHATRTAHAPHMHRTCTSHAPHTHHTRATHAW